MKDKYLELAKQVKSEMTTQQAGCYRLNRLPRSATNHIVALIIKALTSSKGSREAWDEVFQSSLYKNNSDVYCNILAHICAKKQHEVERLREER